MIRTLQNRIRLLAGLLLLTLLLPLSLLADRPAEEASSSAPPPFSMASIKRGKQFYASHCVLCHGADGRGDTQMREFLKTYPANLVDDQWQYGAEDQHLFDVIKQGRSNRDMPAFSDTLSDERIWQTIHYIRYLGGQRP